MSELPKLEVSIWGIRISGHGLIGIIGTVFVCGLIILGVTWVS